MVTGPVRTWVAVATRTGRQWRRADLGNPIHEPTRDAEFGSLYVQYELRTLWDWPVAGEVEKVEEAVECGAYEC